MPYLTKERRKIFDKEIDELIIRMMKTENLCKGDLNYICYRLIWLLFITNLSKYNLVY